MRNMKFSFKGSLKQEIILFFLSELNLNKLCPYVFPYSSCQSAPSIVGATKEVKTQTP